MAADVQRALQPGVDRSFSAHPDSVVETNPHPHAGQRHGQLGLQVQRSAG